MRACVTVTTTVFEFLVLIKAIAVAVNAPDQVWPAPPGPGQKPFAGLAYT